MTPGELTGEIFKREVRAQLGDRPRRVALLLGAGVDGATTGLAAHHLGHRVHAYTFQLGDQENHDSKWAARTARIMGWEWTCVRLPTGVHDVVRNWPRMYRDLHCRKKREFECSWPFLWVYPQIQERFVLNGLHAGSFFGLTRKAFKLGLQGPDGDKRAFDAYRANTARRLAKDGLDALSPEYNPSCQYQHLILQKQHDLINVNPFISAAVYHHFLRYSWMELNVPKQKQFLRQSFPEHLQTIGVRNHRGYQEAGGISTHFFKVLRSPVNYEHRRRPIDMFGDWHRDSRTSRCELVCDQLDAYYARRDRA